MPLTFVFSTKQLSQASAAQNALSTKSVIAHTQKDDFGVHKEGSNGSSPRSEGMTSIFFL